jgi:hypothetical protein
MTMTKKELLDQVDVLNKRIAQLENGDENNGTAMATTAGQPSDNHALGRIAAAMGIDEDHLDDGIRVEDALASAINHDLRLRDKLRSDLQATRMALQRVAAAHGVQKWDADGTEIIEKAQRWRAFGSAILRRIGALEASDPTSKLSTVVKFVRLDELSAVYAQFNGSADLAAWLATLPSDASNLAMFDAAAAQLPAGSPDVDQADGELITPDDVTGDADHKRINALITRVAGSTVATASLLKMINFVLIPHLRRVGA